jgi:twinkle protein
MDKTWDKLHQPCPLCDSSDAVGINEDDSAKCFSCGEFMPSYTKACGGKDMQTTTTVQTKQPDTVGEGKFSALTDRKISMNTAQKYGVKCVHDLNDMLRNNKHKEFVEAWWSAKVYTPSGVINVSEQREKFHNREKKQSVPYPYEGLNKKLYGLRAGELVTLTGGTGLGKSSVTRELEHHLIKNTTDNVGIIALEEDWRRTIDGILSIEANARLYVDQVRDRFSKEELDKFFDILYDGENKNRVWVHSHFGTNDIDDIFTKLRFMIIGCDCKWVVVDHLHMLVSAVHEGDERRAIDSIMTRLRSLVEETGAGIILVSHLRRVDGNKGHENGIEVSLSHLRGSNSIGQLSDCVIALERNQQSDDPEEARTTRLRILKSRYTGDVGMACRVVYDGETGRLSELTDEDITFDNSLDEAF